MKRIPAHRGYPREELQVDSAAGPAGEPVGRGKCPVAPAFLPIPQSASAGLAPPVPASLAAALADDDWATLGRGMGGHFLIGQGGCRPLQLQPPPVAPCLSLGAAAAAAGGSLHQVSGATTPSPTSSVSSADTAPPASGSRTEAFAPPPPCAGSSDESTASLSTVASSSFNLSPAGSPCPTAAEGPGGLTSAAEGVGRGPHIANSTNPLALLLEAARKSRSQQASPLTTTEQLLPPPLPQQHLQQQQLLHAAAASLAPLAAVEGGPSPLSSPPPATEPAVSSGGQHHYQYHQQHHGHYPQPQPYVYYLQQQQQQSPPMQQQHQQQEEALSAQSALPPVAAKLVQTLPGGVPPTAQDIILRQEEVPIWKPEDAPPGNAAFCRNPRYEEVRDGEGGGVDLLPRVRADYMDKYELHPRGEKAKRARREVLTSLSLEEKMERRKERARVYSHIARRRQEAFLRDLNADVDYLNDFKMLVEESPHAILVLSADRDAQLLFVGGAPAGRLHPQPKALLGVSLAALLHPDDRAAWLEAHKAVIVGGSKGETRAQLRCRVQQFAAPPLPSPLAPPGVLPVHPAGYVTAGLSMRRGLQGVIAFLRVEEE